jgi:DNA-binding LacI/PurR family transcriptional regulator
MLKKGRRRATAPNRRATIADVARACGLAPSTVSNALADKSVVRKETRDLVLREAKRLGYRPSSLARGLRLRQTWSIGLLVGDIQNPFFPEVIRGIEDTTAAEGYQVILCNTDYLSDREASSIQFLLDKQVDAFIVDTQTSANENIHRLCQTGVPLVLINQRYDAVETDYVGVDNRAAIEMACHHLWRLGHRSIAHIEGRAGSTAAQERARAYRQALMKAGKAVDESLIVPGDFTLESGDRAARKLLTGRQRPTAILAGNDLMAFGAIGAAMDLGLRVPQQVSVVGIDDIFVASMPSVGLTTIAQPKRQLGACAARLALDRIRGEAPDGPQRVILSGELVIRKTTGPAPAASPDAACPAASLAQNAGD